MAGLAPRDFARYALLAGAKVYAEPGRCVQCGTCLHHCPMGIDVRARARLGLPIDAARCVRCGECVQRCPRGVLYFATPYGEEVQR